MTIVQSSNGASTNKRLNTNFKSDLDNNCLMSITLRNEEDIEVDQVRLRKGVCFYCKKKGNYQKDCRTKQREVNKVNAVDVGSSKPDKCKLKCWLCK